MTSFLDCEIAEIEAVRAAVGQSDLNLWFDQSEIKGRFKKACMQAQSLRCCYCQQFKQTTNNAEWDLEHVLCELHYPQFFATCENLALSCKRCNGAKKQKDVLLPQPRPDPPIAEVPTDPKRYSIPHPRFTNWNEHLGHVNFQIYAGKSEQGVELIAVCELNRPAIEEAGLTREEVVTAIKTNFFETMGGIVDDSVPDEDLLDRITAMTTRNEDARGDMVAVRLGRSLEKLGRQARGRKPEDAAEKARTIVGERKRTVRRGAPRR